MLLEISIRNIALIERLTIEFAQGFNVLTGETGAGKSIVVDSLSLALGARAGRELLRTARTRLPCRRFLTSPIALARRKWPRNWARPARTACSPSRAN